MKPTVIAIWLLITMWPTVSACGQEVDFWDQSGEKYSVSRAWISEAESHLLLGDLENTLMALEQAVQAMPASTTPFNYPIHWTDILSDVYLRKGEFQKAISALVYDLNIGRTVRRDLNLCEAFCGVKDITNARSVSREPERRLLRQLPFLQQQDLPSLTTLESTEARCHFLRGLDELGKNHILQARERFVRSLNLVPHTAAVCFLLGVTYLQTKSPSEATTWLDKAEKNASKSLKAEIETARTKLIQLKAKPGSNR